MATNDNVIIKVTGLKFRGDTSHSRDKSRFGLGLSIVSAIVKAQGEECGVYNTETGVCFWFTCKKAEKQVSCPTVES